MKAKLRTRSLRRRIRRARALAFLRVAVQTLSVDERKQLLIRLRS